MRISPRAPAAAASIATVFLLAACGGSDETTERTGSTPVASSVQYGGESWNNAERHSENHGARKSGEAGDRDGGKAEGEEGQGNGKRPQPQKRTVSDGGGSSGGKGKRPSGCPKGSSAAQCAEAGEALEKSSSRTVPADECPQAVDAATCEQAGKAYAEAEEGGRTVQPDECPRAMTAEQCRLAGEAYAEATR